MVSTGHLGPGEDWGTLYIGRRAKSKSSLVLATTAPRSGVARHSRAPSPTEFDKPLGAQKAQRPQHSIGVDVDYGDEV